MQVAADPISLIQEGCHVLGVARGGQLEREGGLRGQGFSEGELGAVELGSTDLAQEDEDAR